jgi:predicted Zn-dependent protease
VQVRLGALEDVERSEGEEIGLRLFVGRRSASVSSSDLSGEALTALVERAIAMAREAPEDPYSGLAPEEKLLRGAGPDVEGRRWRRSLADRAQGAGAGDGGGRPLGMPASPIRKARASAPGAR